MAATKAGLTVEPMAVPMAEPTAAWMDPTTVALRAGWKVVSTVVLTARQSAVRMAVPKDVQTVVQTVDPLAVRTVASSADRRARLTAESWAAWMVVRMAAMMADCSACPLVVKKAVHLGYSTVGHLVAT
jgi:hypothetical protein